MFQRTLSQSAQDALAVLGKSKILDFAYMAGGSALALQLGHRQSEDFDFFSAEEFDIEKIKVLLGELGTFKLESETNKMIVGSFMGVKWSLFGYPYPLISPTLDFGGIKLAGSDDISAMKMAATLGRATRKDYVDIYFLIKAVFGLEKMLELYDKKYRNLEINRFALIKGLQYFEDVEATKMPVMYEEVNWEAVKEFLRGEAKRYWGSL